LPLKRGRESGFSGTVSHDVTFPLDMPSQPTPLRLVTFTVDLRPAAGITRNGSSVVVGMSANSSLMCTAVILVSANSSLMCTAVILVFV